MRLISKPILPIFRESKAIDSGLIFWAWAYLVLFLISDDTPKIIIGLIASVMFLLFLIAGALLEKRAKYEEMEFLGTIAELTMAMKKHVGLSLSSKIDNYYIYKTNHRILPNYEYIAIDYGEYCTIILDYKIGIEEFKKALLPELSESGTKQLIR